LSTAIIQAGPAPVHPHLLGADHLLEVAGGNARQALAEDLVEPDPGMVAVDAKFEHFPRAADGSTPID
jgi:hypothetical protein